MYVLLHRYKGITLTIITLATGGFFLWLFLQGGVADITAPSKRCVAEVGSGCITLRDYRRELLRFSSLLQNSQMEDVIKEQVLSNLIAQELLYQKAIELSFVASDEEVVEVIKSDPTFQENGLFSATRYREVLSKAGLTTEEYEAYLKKTISVQKLINFLTNGVYLTDLELEKNLLAESTLLSGSLYIVNTSELKEKYTPTEQELLEYYRKNKESFKRPEGRVVLVWKEKDKDRALGIYQGLKSGNLSQGYKEYRLPEELQELQNNLREEAQRLSMKDRATVRKEGEEYVVLYLKELFPAGYEDFEKVKEKVKERVLEEKAETLTLKRAEEVAKELKEGKKPDVKSLNFSSTPATQLSTLLDIDRRTLLSILLSEDRVFGPYSLRQGYGVVYVEKRTKKEIKKEEREELSRDILSLKAQAVLSQYIEHLKKTTKININRELLGGG